MTMKVANPTDACPTVIEDGANAITEEHRAGWPGSRIGGHQTTTWRLASCSFRMNPSTREASPAVRSCTIPRVEFCVHGIVMHLRLEVFDSVHWQHVDWTSPDMWPGYALLADEPPSSTRCMRSVASVDEARRSGKL